MTSPPASESLIELRGLGVALKQRRWQWYGHIALRLVLASYLLNVPKIINRLAHKWTGFDLPGWLFVLLTGICFFGMAVVAFTERARFKPAHWQSDELVRRQLERLEELTSTASKEEINAVLAALWEARGALQKRQLSRIETHLAPLLLHMEPDEAQELTNTARRYLRERARNSDCPELRVAALLVLAELADRAVPELARLAQSSADERLKAAGAEVLPAKAGFP